MSAIRCGTHTAPANADRARRMGDAMRITELNLYLNASDYTITDDTRKTYTPEQARKLWESGKVSNYNLSFYRLASNDFDIEKLKAYYAEQETMRRGATQTNNAGMLRERTIANCSDCSALAKAAPRLPNGRLRMVLCPDHCGEEIVD